MTISSPIRRNNYIGNGSTPDYDYGFRIFAVTDLRVIVVVAGAKTVLTYGTHYTVDGVGDAAGGTISLVAGAFDWLDADDNLDDDVILAIRGVRPVTQPTSIRNGGDYFPARHEDAFDNLAMIDAQQQDELERCIRLDESIDPDDFDMTLPVDIASNPGASIIVNETGDGLSVGVGSFSVSRVFNNLTFPALKAAAAADPTSSRFGFATDLVALCYYTADVSIGDEGWIIVAGAGSAPGSGGPI